MLACSEDYSFEKEKNTAFDKLQAIRPGSVSNTALTSENVGIFVQKPQIVSCTWTKTKEFIKQIPRLIKSDTNGMPQLARNCCTTQKFCRGLFVT